MLSDIDCAGNPSLNQRVIQATHVSVFWKFERQVILGTFRGIRRRSNISQEERRLFTEVENFTFGIPSCVGIQLLEQQEINTSSLYPLLFERSISNLAESAKNYSITRFRVLMTLIRGINNCATRTLKSAASRLARRIYR